MSADVGTETEEAGTTLRARHRELLQEIESLFMRRGYRALTMDDLARALHCSKRALYEIAPNRKALFLAVIERWTERVQHLGIEAAAGAGDAKARLAAFLSPGVTETVEISEAFLDDLQAFPSARAALEAHQRRRIDALRTIVAEGIGQGAFKPLHAHLVAEICLAAYARINQPDFLRQAGLSFSDAFAELYRVLTTGILEDPAG